MQPVISYIPSKFTFTIICKCNLRCPTCQYLINDPEMFEQADYMPLDLYKSILLKYQDHMKRITLTGGEPLLHPEIGEFIDFARSLKISVGLPTNGILIKNKLSILKKVSGHIQISLDAYDHESFYMYRAGTEKQWQSMVEGMQLLSENNIKFNISFLISKSNADQIVRMLEFAKSVRPVLVNFHSFNPHRGSIGLILREDDFSLKNILSEIMRKKDYSYDIRLPIVFDLDSEYFKTKVCEYPWNGVYVSEKGFIAYCCQLAHDESIGNIGVNYDFNSPKMQNWRKMLLDHKLSKDCVYCHRRFIGDEIIFNARERSWITH